MSASSSPDRVLHASDVLSRDEIRAFTRTSDLPGWFALASTWGVIAAAFTALAVWPGVVMFVAVVIVLGGRQLALAVAMHEAAHGTLFRTRALNEGVADWLAARPVWADVARYRKHHLAHHAHTGTERDPDLALAPVRPMTRGSLARKIARDLTGASGLRRVIGLFLIDAGVLTFNVGGGTARAPWRGLATHLTLAARNLWKPIVANAAMLGVLAATGHAWLYLAWLAAYLTTFGLFVRVRSLAEHAVMARGPDPLRNTRTTRASWLARATVAPLCVNHHLEHHLLPTVPWFRLPALGRTLADRGVVPSSSHAPSYAGVLRIVSARR
jgi:fatty acid desaturase